MLSYLYSYLHRYFQFIREYQEFKKKCPEAYPFRPSWKDRTPCLMDRNPTVFVDGHYVYHPIWALKILLALKPKVHVDISSIHTFAAHLSLFMPVRYYDFQKVPLDLMDLEVGTADVTHLPFETESIPSISCMHVVEHVGLGRYGGNIEPAQDLRAFSELGRVVSKQGHLLIVVPIAAKRRLEFNAHRVYEADDIFDFYSKDFELRDFTLIPDKAEDGSLIKDPSQDLLDRQTYGCGCFWFQKR